MTTPFVSVIIVNYNSGNRLMRCLDCLDAQWFSDFEVIVIDNASIDDSIEKAKQKYPAHQYKELDENLGFAAGNNRAVAESNAEWVAFLNPDAYAEPNWLEVLVDATTRYTGVDAFGSTQLCEEDPSLIDGAGDAYHIFGIPYRGHHGWPIEKLPPAGECFAPCAAAAMYRRSTFKKLGGFEESFFCYCEDVDLGFRLRLAGGRAIQLPDARVLHEGSGITGRDSAFTIYHGHRNRIWTWYRNVPLAILLLTVPVQVIFTVYLSMRFALLGQFSAFARAVIHGLEGIPTHSDQRRKQLRLRQASVASLASMMTISPISLMTKGAKVRSE